MGTAQFVQQLNMMLWLALSCLFAVALAQTLTPDIDCYVGNGAGYKGEVAVTVAGAVCQEWASQTPHKHSYPQGGPSNVCRNPSGNSGGPWCYTTSSTRWDYCPIVDCDHLKQYIRAGRQCYNGVGEGQYFQGVTTDKNGNECYAWTDKEDNYYGLPAG